jgi:hypothetical protein
MDKTKEVSDSVKKTFKNKLSILGITTKPSA